MAFIPGLKITENAIVRKIRRLPVKGEVLVKIGDSMNPNTKIARCEIIGESVAVNVAAELKITPKDIKRYTLKKEGEKVEKGEEIALTYLIFNYFKKSSHAPISGTIERISDLSGQMIITGDPKPLELSSYIPGTVIEVIPFEGAVVETPAAIIQGILGVGGETHGDIHVVTEFPEDVLTSDKIGPECTDKIIVGGSLVKDDALKKAVDVGAKGIIVGGIDSKDLSNFMGYELGVAITGHEELGLTLIITEGFGRLEMSENTFHILKKYNGRLACINGTTQIRAGVLRPEIIIPHPEIGSDIIESTLLNEGLRIGTSIRIIRSPYFGFLAHVTNLPPELQILETGSKVRILEAELQDGRRVIVPRANVEMVEWRKKNDARDTQ